MYTTHNTLLTMILHIWMSVCAQLQQVINELSQAEMTCHTSWCLAGFNKYANDGEITNEQEEEACSVCWHQSKHTHKHTINFHQAHTVLNVKFC